ncbi:hypothetical protein LTR95_007162 [Oleoguttula sp. CCFEE 5521]
MGSPASSPISQLSAVAGVFGIVELLENILIYFAHSGDAHAITDLFILQLVSQTFARTIQDSLSIRCAMRWTLDPTDSRQDRPRPVLFAMRLPTDTYIRRNMGATATGYHTNFQGSDL